MFTEKQKKKVLKMYDQGYSTSYIAIKTKSYPNKVNRLLVKSGVTIRSKAEAQTLSLAMGISEHPTKGRVRTKIEKEKISGKLTDYWENLPEKVYAKRIEKSKEVWDKKTDKEKEEMRTSAAKAMAKACKEGSKLENFLQKALTDLGYNVIFHKKGLVENHNLEIDLFLPDLNLIIEIDGPTHFLPIFGEEKLEKVMESDRVKNGLLISKGFAVLRFKYLCRRFGERHKRAVVKRLQEFFETDLKPGTILEIEVEG